MFRPPRRRQIALFLVASYACAHIPQQTQLAKQSGLEASTSELRTRAVELGRELMREIEYAADSIDAGTVDPQIRANTLYWKLSSVPAMTEAVLREDPVIAMVDLYGFRVQLSDFLASPTGQAAFGKDVTVAQQAMVRFDQRWETVAAAVGSKMTEANRDSLRAFAKRHPIDRLPFTRASLVGGMAYTMRAENSSIGASVGGMQESMDRLEFRISLVNEYGIKQAGWLAQLAALEMRRSPEAAELKDMLTSSQTLLGSSQTLMAGAPDLIERERSATLAEVDRQRLATLADLATERGILLEAIANERAQILIAVDQQRRLLTQDADSMRVRLIADEIRVIDHVMLRFAELGGLAFVAIVLLVLLLRRRV